MSLQPSRILRILREGGYPAVIKAGFADPRVIEIAGLCGVDAVWLCNEHVPTDWIDLENQVRAARLYGVDALVRVARGSYSDYIKPLEMDAAGIIVPHVTTADEARQIVDWVRFHPLGRRALDGGSIDGRFCMVPVAEYLEHSNREKVVILQIESPEALEQVERICAVPGFNGICFGPGDFSHRIGKAGQLDDPQVVAARRRVAAATPGRPSAKRAASSASDMPAAVAIVAKAWRAGTIRRSGAVPEASVSHEKPARRIQPRSHSRRRPSMWTASASLWNSTSGRQSSRSRRRDAATDSSIARNGSAPSASFNGRTFVTTVTRSAARSSCRALPSTSSLEP
jgi:4-hydroxy-2-oxoheptanedioate aldolase